MHNDSVFFFRNVYCIALDTQYFFNQTLRLIFLIVAHFLRGYNLRAAFVSLGNPLTPGINDGCMDKAGP